MGNYCQEQGGSSKEVPGQGERAVGFLLSCFISGIVKDDQWSNLFQVIKGCNLLPAHLVSSDGGQGTKLLLCPFFFPPAYSWGGASGMQPPHQSEYLGCIPCNTNSAAPGASLLWIAILGLGTSSPYLSGFCLFAYRASGLCHASGFHPPGE